MSKEPPRIAFLKERYFPIILENINTLDESWFGVRLTPESALMAHKTRATHIFDKILAADPDQSTHKNSQTMLQWCINGDIDGLRLFYITEDLKFFSAVKLKPEFEGSSNIATYRTPEELAMTLSPYRTMFMRSRHMLQCDGKYLDICGGEGASVVFQDMHFRLLRMHTKEATRDYTKKMRSCVAYNRLHNDFEDYSQDLLLLQRADGKRWLMSFMSGQWRDENDLGQNIDLSDVIANHPALQLAIRPYVHNAIMEQVYYTASSVEPLVQLCLDMPVMQDEFTSSIHSMLADCPLIGAHDFLEHCLLIRSWSDAVSPEQIITLLQQSKSLDKAGLADLITLIETNADAVPHWHGAVRTWDRKNKNWYENFMRPKFS